MRQIKEIIIHCSATPEGEDFTVDQIRRMHIARGFSDIGYHYVVYRDGSVHKGRPENISGAHCTGHNSISVGVCYIGGCPPRSEKDWMRRGKDTRTPAQKAALLTLVNDLKGRFPSATVHGHREFASKACPCFDAGAEYNS